jgi:hypothetical protein
MQIFLLVAVLIIGSPSFSTAQVNSDPPCMGAYHAGNKPTDREIESMIKSHAEWHKEVTEISLKDPLFQGIREKFHVTSWEIISIHFLPEKLINDHRRANLCNANLEDRNFQDVSLRFGVFRNAKLSAARFNGANLYMADFRGSHLFNTDFSRTNLEESDFRDAIVGNVVFVDANLADAKMNNLKIKSANFNGANLSSADFSGGAALFLDLKFANLESANLKDATVSGGDWSNARLIHTKMANSNFTNINVDQTVFEPAHEWTPEFDQVRTWQNLSKITYQTSPRGLYLIQKNFRDNGFRDLEREVVFAIWRTKRANAPIAEKAFLYILFELPSGYGLYPGRPLWILVGAFAICGFIYVWPILNFSSNPTSHSGIFRDWAKDRVRQDFGTRKPERLSQRGFRAFPYAFYFSLLSAFHIGWRDLNVGNWIARIQPREYSLRATGWVRVVSGVQSLLSVYLIALWALVYFGRPFE